MTQPEKTPKLAKGPASIKSALRGLRQLIEDNDTPAVERRIAGAVEEAIRWVTEDTVGWQRPDRSVMDWGRLLRSEQ